MIDWLRKEYESIFQDGSGKMTVSRGKVHTYLGMTLDYTTCGQVKITMLDYIEEILDAFLREGSVGLRCITLYQIAELKLESFRNRILERREHAHEIEAPIVERALRALDGPTPDGASTT